MRYLFAFKDHETCERFQGVLEAEGILCEIRTAKEFSDGTQGPELWVRAEDYAAASNLINDLQNER